jgi:hypothetical protein
MVLGSLCIVLVVKFHIPKCHNLNTYIYINRHLDTHNYEFIHIKIRAVTIFELFPDIQFYDYTKNPTRDQLPKNYDLTFSYSNKSEFQKFNEIAIKKGMRLSAVFSDKNLPAYFMNREVLNGDESDLTFLAPKNTILGLYAKGKAKKDTGGFIIKTIPILAI